LLVVTTSDSEDVTFELFSQDFTFDLLTHSSVVEGTTTKRVSANQCTRANLADGDSILNQLLTCTFHLQYQFSFGHQLWGR
jgi:hypothetical protein